MKAEPVGVGDANADDTADEVVGAVGGSVEEDDEIAVGAAGELDG